MGATMSAYRVASVLGALVLMATATAAVADDATDFATPDFYGRGKNTSVMERERPDYDAIGIHAGGFTLFPKLQLGAIATDNVLDVPSSPNSTPPTSPKSAVGFVVAPSISAQSNWGRHSLTVSANVAETVYSLSSEDTTTAGVRADGRIDVHDESHIDLGADVERAVLPRGGSTSQVVEANPVPFNYETTYARGVYGVDRVRGTLEADFANFDFQDVPRVGGGTPVDEAIRNFYQDRVLGRGEYALSPDAALFVSVSEGQEIYASGTAQFPARNATETRVLGGANFDLTALARGEIGLGYVDRDYTNGVYRPLKGLAVSSKIEYFPTQLLTITFIGQRLVEDSAFNTASGYFKNFASLGADYEFKRNIILSLLGSLEQDTFQGAPRTDDAASIAASGKYLVNRNVGIGATLAYTNRTSDVPSSLTPLEREQLIGPIYNEVRFTLNLVLQR